ncbi:hypothetical protein OEZ86_001657 [Tetradesmus obliquus]|nr:hypothetical protein OEZ86_001657 [Tetradesmus obliquus]
MHWWPSLPTAPEQQAVCNGASPAPALPPTPVVQYDPSLWGGAGYGYKPSFGAPWLSPSPQPISNPLRKISSEPALDKLPDSRAAADLLNPAKERSGIQKPPSMDDMHAGNQQQQPGNSSSSSSRQVPASAPSSSNNLQQLGHQHTPPHTQPPAAGTPGMPPLPPSSAGGSSSGGGWLRTRRVSSSIHIGMAAA